MAKKMDTVVDALKQVAENQEKITKTKTINWIKIVPEDKEENQPKELENVKRMIVDTGCPNSIVGNSWLNEYLKKRNVNKNELKSENCLERFRFRPSKEYEAVKIIEIPITIKTSNKKETFEEVKIEAFVIETEEIPLLCGKTQ
jgi:hypothetical protein